MDDNQVLGNGVSNLVQKSTNYDQFTLLGTNREIYQGHVELLKQAFEEVGNLTKVQPILVNERYDIIDGQHRFLACKELHQPIYFTMVPGLGIREARSMNILHRGWRIDDWMASYAAEGKKDYIQYLALKEDYGFNHSVTLACILGDRGDKGIYPIIRNGEFEIEDMEGSVKRLNMLSEIGEIVGAGFASDRYFVRAWLSVITAEGYDHQRMLKRLAKAGTLLKRYASRDDYCRMLEEIYNHNMSEVNRVRLY